MLEVLRVDPDFSDTQKKIEWSTMKTIECLCIETIGLIVAFTEFDVLSIFSLKASLLVQIIVLRSSISTILLFYYSWNKEN